MTKTPDEYAEELKNVETFDLNSALTGVTRPKDHITIYTDGERAHQLEEVLSAISVLSHEKAGLIPTGGITGNPRSEEIDGEIASLEEAQDMLIATLRSTSLTFHLRGLPPKQTRLIVKGWEKKIKPESKQPSEEEQAEVNEIRSDKINAELIAKCTVKVVNGNGAEYKGAVTPEWVENLQDEINSGEFHRLVQLANSLSVAHGIFNNVLAADADFLSKP